MKKLVLFHDIPQYRLPQMSPVGLGWKLIRRRLLVNKRNGVLPVKSHKEFPIQDLDTILMDVMRVFLNQLLIRVANMRGPNTQTKTLLELIQP